MTGWQQEIINRERFSFGRNWVEFLKTINRQRVSAAEESLTEMLGVTTLEGKSFLDIGCGSGLFSLAAVKLGAKVMSFDNDPLSIACTEALKSKMQIDNDWQIEQGSVLDVNYLSKLDIYDIVYSWGVLHHTGNMWAALENVISLVKDGGLLYIAIYNDQGIYSRFWKKIKRFYIKGGKNRRTIMLAIYSLLHMGMMTMYDILRFQNPISRYSLNMRRRGMSIWHDMVDWLGGYPFETSKPGKITEFYAGKGFVLIKTNLVGNRRGCNEYLFQKKVIDEC